jgi:hypothetical protein
MSGAKMMDLEDALNLGLPPYLVERLVYGEEVQFRAELPGYPQCTGYGASAAEALRAARHFFTHVRDSQAAVAVCDMKDEQSDRLREAMRVVVTRALV